MSSALTEILIVVALMIANGLFSMSEMAVVSARKARLKQRANSGTPGASAALKLAEEPADFLSMVQIGITLISILTGVFGGATLSDEGARLLRQIEPLAPYAETLSFVLVVTTITFFSLLVGELIPKNLALRNPEGISSFIAPPMNRLARLTAPLVRFLSFSTNTALRLMGIKPSTEPSVTEDEIRVLMHEGTRIGAFEATERDMVGHVFRLSDLQISTLMLPRTELLWLDVNDSKEILCEKLSGSQISRLPVAQDSLDQVMGMVWTKDLLTALLKGEAFNLRAHLQEPLFLPETTSAMNALRAMRTQGAHNALVLDEYGGLQGMVTVDDILDEIIGDTMPSNMFEEPQIIERADGSWLLDGLLSIEKLKALLGLKILPDEEDYRTLGGFVMHMLMRIPMSSDVLEHEQWRFEVVDMDGHRVDKVMVSERVPEPSVNAPSQ